MALQAASSSRAPTLTHRNHGSSVGKPPARQAAPADTSIDDYVPASPRRTWHHARPHAAPLKQGDQRASKDIGSTIINDFIFGFVASCGAAAFRSLCGSCCR